MLVKIVKIDTEASHQALNGHFSILKVLLHKWTLSICFVNHSHCLCVVVFAIFVPICFLWPHDCQMGIYCLDSEVGPQAGG